MLNRNEVSLPQPTIENMLAFAPLDASVLVLIAVVLAVLYMRGAIFLWSRKRKWSVPRTVSFLLGCVLLFLVGSLGVNRYGSELVAALVFQQITLMTVVPPLLILGSPGRLLLRSTPHRGIGKLVLRAAHAGLGSRTARFALHPVIAIVVAATLFMGLYLTDLVSLIIVLPFGHELLLLLFLGGGIVAGVPLWSSDPLPRAPSYAARLADAIVEIQIHAIFGLILIRTGKPMFSAFADLPLEWAVDPLQDQVIAGTLAWTYAELPLLIVIIVILSRWRTRDLKLAKLRQSSDDEELEQYNEYLASLKKYPDKP